MDEKQPGRFVTAFFVEPFPMAERFENDRIPLHMTLFPPVNDRYTKAMSDSLRRAVHPLDPFTIKVGREAVLTLATTNDSEQSDILVKKIESTHDIQRLYGAIAGALRPLLQDKVFRQYRPHITVTSSDELKTGSAIAINGFSIVEKTSDKYWSIIDTIGLKGEHS